MKKTLSLQKLLISLTIIALVSLTACKKTIEEEITKLPPATQTGANTFGCMVNGKAWIPDNGCTLLCPPSLKFYYDNSNGGLFAITAYYKTSTRDETIIIGIDSLNFKTHFSFSNTSQSVRLSFDNHRGCDLSSLIDSAVNTQGFANINKYDLSSGIISGTFEFTLSKPGCETINIGNGRFDAKL